MRASNAGHHKHGAVAPHMKHRTKKARKVTLRKLSGHVARARHGHPKIRRGSKARQEIIV
jgi:hypothetical protein